MSVIDTLITYRSANDVARLKQLLRKGWQNMTQDERDEYSGGVSALQDKNDEYLFDSNSEQLFVLGGQPLGAYNYADLNRVETAVAYVAAELYAAHATLQAYATSLGVAWDSLFDVPYDYTDYASLTTKTDWTDEDIMYAADATRYLGNLVLIAAAYETGVALPASMNGLDYSGANAIERLLIAIDRALADDMEYRETLIRGTLAVNYSGEIYSGEGVA